ncbi:MAG TPA: Crp/Fnr family transcriptional regulator [Anaerolineae bacterium]|nr:Crp/Fnr family transcriptional regulator [Anaerolineae bacterium]
MSKPASDVLARHIASLKRVPLFADLKENQLSLVAQDFRLRTYEKDATIFRQDDWGREMYIILEGKVRIFKLSPAGDETSIRIFTIGDIIGELSALDRQARSASAKAIGRCALLELPGDLLVQRMREIPELAISLARLLAGKLRWTAEYAETVAQYDAAGRLLHILLLYNEQFGSEQEAGKRYELELALNQADLASLVGARREWVNRILQDWQRRGLIEYHAGKLILLDLPRVIQERDSRIEGNRPDAKW